MYNDDGHPHLYNLAVTRMFCMVRYRAYYTLEYHYFRHILFSYNDDICEPMLVCDLSLVQRDIVLWGAPGKSCSSFKGFSGIFNKIGLVAEPAVVTGVMNGMCR
jgi:hypothetical protein